MYTTETFIKRAKEIHGDKYDYSKVNYVNGNTKVCIICPEHGEFWQNPYSHLQNHGCPECGKLNSNILSAAGKKASGGERFVKLSKKKHGDKFDYSKVRYVDYETPVEIICPKHGSFYQLPKYHYRSAVCCPECVKEMGFDFASKGGCNRDEFIEKAKKIYGDKYDYSKVEYVNNRTRVTIMNSAGECFDVVPSQFLSSECKVSRRGRKVTTETFIRDAKRIWGDKYDYSKTEYVKSRKKVIIICPIHGEVEVYPSAHLNKKKYSGCPKCNTEKQLDDMAKIKKPRKKTEEEKLKRQEERRKQKEKAFIEKARRIHGDKYDYSKVVYEASHKKVCIICPEHGEFWQTPNDHADRKARGGTCCPMCGKNGKRQKKYTQEEYIGLASKVFGGFYDYSKTVYRAMQKPIIVTCPEHGDFEIRAFDHLRNKCGCPEHHVKSTLELQVESMLQEHGIEYVYEKRFSWLGLMSLDFYLPKYNMAIECQGSQHFVPVESWGGVNNCEAVKKRDSLKRELCEENSVELLYYTNKGLMKYATGDKSQWFFDLEKLCEKIFSKSST